MDLTIERAALLRALAAAGSAVDRNSKAPVLRCVLLEATTAALRITGCDVAQECSAEALAAVADAGAVCLGEAHLDAFVKGLPSGAEVSIRAGRTDAVIRSGRASIKLPVLPAIDFPRMAIGDGARRLAISAPTLSALLSSTVAACEPPNGRYAFTGVHVEVLAGRITAVATDGRRMHIALSEIPDADAAMSIIVGSEAVKLIRGLIKDAGEVAVTATDGMIEVETAAAIYRCKLIEGTFVDWRRLAFDSYGYTARLDRATIVGAMTRVRSALGIERPAIVIVPRAGEIEIACHDPADGRVARDIVPAETTGEWNPLATRMQHLSDAIDAVPGDIVTIAIAAEVPQRIRVHGDEPGAYALVSPFDALTAHDRVAIDGSAPQIEVAA